MTAKAGAAAAVAPDVDWAVVSDVGWVAVPDAGSVDSVVSAVSVGFVLALFTSVSGAQHKTLVHPNNLHSARCGTGVQPTGLNRLRGALLVEDIIVEILLGRGTQLLKKDHAVAIKVGDGVCRLIEAGVAL
jgi:hypothetical protein